MYAACVTSADVLLLIIHSHLLKVIGCKYAFGIPIHIESLFLGVNWKFVMDIFLCLLRLMVGDDE